jgi:hypothetical protein
MSIDSLPSRRGGDRYSSANEGQMFLVVRKGCMGLRQFGPAWGALLSAGRHCEDVEARLVPPTGVEPAHMASEANALSAELRGQCFANIGSWCPVLPGRSRLAQEECRIIWKRPQFAPLTTALPKCRRVCRDRLHRRRGRRGLAPQNVLQWFKVGSPLDINNSNNRSVGRRGAAGDQHRPGVDLLERSD